MANKLSINLNGKRQKIQTINGNYIQNEIYYSKDLTPEVLSNIPLVLPNLASYEFLSDRLVLKTPMITGDSVYEDSSISSSTRIDVINKYLKIIEKFSVLPIFLQINLMRLENFYLTKGELIHRGVLIVEDCQFNYPFTNEHVLKTISFFTLKIIHNDPALINFENYFKNLDTQKKTVLEIIEDIKKIYIRDLFHEKKFTSKAPKRKMKSKFKNINLTFAFSIVLFVFFLIGSMFLINKANTDDLSDKPIIKIEEKKENSSYILIDKSFSSKENTLIIFKEWNLYEDGKLIQTENGDIFTFLPIKDKSYKVTFKVKDSNGAWSEEMIKLYSLKDEEAYDNLNNLKISSAIFTDKEFKDGIKSIDINASNKDFYINETILARKVNISFYVKSSTYQSAKIMVTGYHSSALEAKSSKEIQLQKNTWQRIDLSMEGNDISKIKVELEYEDGDVFLDKISLTSSKE